MASIKRGTLIASILMLVTVTISACDLRYSTPPAATNTPLSQNLFSTPIAQTPGMNDVELFGTGTALALTGSPVPGAATNTPAGITPQTATNTPTPAVNAPTNPTMTPTATLAVSNPTVSGPTATLIPSGSKPSTYTLRSGEFPYCIARRFYVDPDELLAASGLTSALPPARHGAAPEGADPGFAGVVRDQDSPAALELDVVSYGLAVAFRPTESLSLGVSLSLSDGRMRVASEEYLPDDDSIDSYFGAGSFLPSRLEKITTVDLDDTAWTLGAGFLWRIASGWRFGGFYRQGPEFTMELGTKAGPASPYMASGSVSSPVALPDVYGLGIAYRTAGGHLTLAVALLQARWLVLAGTEASIPVPFLVILVFWLTITFASFGLCAPRHATVLAVLFVCALSVGSAVFLVLEMDTPFDGVLKVSADPLRYAYAHLNQ